jgi:endonuclease/exonuclease/phosphatase family metal-dependent hydrolase
MSAGSDFTAVRCARRQFCLAAALLCFAFDAIGATVVRVLDWNIHRDIGGTDSNVSAQDELAEVVNYLNPDVWTINELGGNSSSFNITTARNQLVSFVQSNLTIFGASPRLGTNFFVYVGTENDGFITNAIVSRYPFLSTQTYSDAGGGFSALRGLTMGFVDLPGTTDLGVFTAHLKASSGATNANQRQAEAEADRASIANWLGAHASAAAVMTGDFNESEDPGDTRNAAVTSTYHPITTLKSAGLADAMPVSIRGDNDTINSTNPTARFDYVLYTANKLSLIGGEIFDTKQYTFNQLSALNSANGTAFVAADSATASDHLPVLAVFSVIPEPGTGALLVIGVALFWKQRRRA